MVFSFGVVVMRILLRAYMILCSALLNFVLLVVVVGPLKQVFSVAARWVVAVVTDLKFFRVFSVCEEIGYPVRAYSPIEFLFRKHLAQTIALSVERLFPWPTFVRDSDIHFGPKAISLFLSKLREWYKLAFRHLISFTDLLLRAARARRTLSWPNLHYSTEVC